MVVICNFFHASRTLGMGGLFISIPDPPPIDTKLRLSFEVPGGNVLAEAIVRNIVPGEGMGVEFTRLGLKDRVLLEQWLKWLLGDEAPTLNICQT